MPTIETVLGPIDASALGATLSHEHVLVGMGLIIAGVLVINLFSKSVGD